MPRDKRVRLLPGVSYLTRWILDASSGRALAYFATAASVGGLLSAAGSGILLSVLDGVGGVRGWRWLLFVEGVPTIVLGLAAPMLLNERPQEAAWLSTTERAELVDALASTQLASVASGSAKGAPRRTLVHTLRETPTTVRPLASPTLSGHDRQLGALLPPDAPKEVYPIAGVGPGRSAGPPPYRLLPITAWAVVVVAAPSGVRRRRRFVLAGPG